MKRRTDFKIRLVKLCALFRAICLNSWNFHSKLWQLHKFREKDKLGKYPFEENEMLLLFAALSRSYTSALRNDSWNSFGELLSILMSMVIVPLLMFYLMFWLPFHDALSSSIHIYDAWYLKNSLIHQWHISGSIESDIDPKRPHAHFRCHCRPSIVSTNWEVRTEKEVIHVLLPAALLKLQDDEKATCARSGKICFWYASFTIWNFFIWLSSTN